MLGSTIHEQQNNISQIPNELIGDNLKQTAMPVKPEEVMDNYMPLKKMATMTKRKDSAAYPPQHHPYQRSGT